jgi:hypothetical protein
MGEIATRGGKLDEGIAQFREALKIEDAGLYFELPKWYYPIRQSLGAALLKAGPECRSGSGLSGGLQAVPGERVVTVRAGCRPEGTGQVRRGGRGGPAVRESVVAGGRQADGVTVLTIPGPPARR